MDEAHLSARDAAERLGVTLPTLYAYVSRGLVRSERTEGARERRYRAEDVAALRGRKQGRKDPGRVAEAALHWGLPVLDSAITLMAEGRLYYRGRDVMELATSKTIEQVAALLWTGDLEASLADASVTLPRPVWGGFVAATAGLPLAERMQTILPIVEAHDPFAYDLRPEAVALAGARILRLLAAVAVGRRPGERGVARTLASGWTSAGPHAEDLLQATLVLWADHELNPSTFTARCAASAGATPYAVVAAGLAAFRGFRHGRACERVEALFDEVGQPRRARAALEARLRRGEVLPGFGHPLYPKGDPRAAALLALIAEKRSSSPGTLFGRALSESVANLVGAHPNIDFALVCLRRSLELPAGAGVALIAIGRAVGWIAHAIEQYQDERLIRPRARYVGELPPALPGS